MYLKNKMSVSTEPYSDSISIIADTLKKADAVITGIGAGMSTAAGFTYSGARFEKYFSDFQARYGIQDMYSGGFYPFPSLEEYWAWWSRHIYYNRYDVQAGKPYTDLFKILQDKNYFIITTNVDHQIQKAGFDTKRLFYTQGDYGLWQCSVPCHNKTYNNEQAVREMIERQSDMKIPSALIPYCPVCAAPMTMHLRSDGTFVEDEAWHRAHKRYTDFLMRHENKRNVFLELGVGNNTPGIIKYPFMKMTRQNNNARYISINMEAYHIPPELTEQTLFIQGDIKQVLEDISEKIKR